MKTSASRVADPQWNDRLRNLRHALRVDQETMAARLSVSREWISKLEGHRVSASLAIQHKIAALEREHRITRTASEELGKDEITHCAKAALQLLRAIAMDDEALYDVYGDLIQIVEERLAAAIEANEPRPETEEPPSNPTAEISDAGNLSRALRQALGGLTQAELANVLLVSRNFISQIEANLKRPSARLGREMRRLLREAEQRPKQ